jgi:molybdenum cofactor cytidylyltransferase
VSNQSSNIAVVILAAGASKRMGSPKQLLNWGDETLITHAIQKALMLNSEEVIVVLGANYELIKQGIQHFPITILNNKEWKFGLGKSIACASNYLKNQKENSEGMLIMLVDQPFITTSYLQELISHFSVNKNQIIATSYQKENYGVPALFDNHYFEQLSKLNDDFGAKYILKDNEIFIKALIPPVNNVDLDNKEDYEKLHKANFKNR